MVAVTDHLVAVFTCHSRAVYFWNKASIPSTAVLPSVCATLNHMLEAQLFLWSPCAFHTKHSLSPPRQGPFNTQSALHRFSCTHCSERGTAFPLNDFDLFSMAHLSHLKTCINFKPTYLFPEEFWLQHTHNKQTNTQTCSSYIRYTLIFVFRGLI
jgi:hypothetical protein